MNLSTDPWIPIVWENGEPDMVSLADAFARGHEIRDLTVRPHERIALMRLLICIAQAALDGPADRDDWKNSRPQISPTALDYLHRWKAAFELFGDGQRFLQVQNLKKAGKKETDDAGNSVSKLDLALATGNNSTLFDNAGGAMREFTNAQLALNLLTYQCHSPGGRIGVALWDGKESPGEGSSDHAPCLAGGMLHALVRGARLLETVLLNLLDKSRVTLLYGEDRWGQPVWEQLPDNIQSGAAIRNATATYLGRLVPLTRTVRLDDSACAMVLANGLEFPAFPQWREPMSTVIVRTVKDNQERALLRARLDRAPWRELHSLTVKTVSQSGSGGPLSLQNVTGNDSFDLWVGGMAADKAKLLEALESVIHIPAAMLTDPAQRAYEAGVKHAEDMGFRLGRAVSLYHNAVGDNLDRAEARDRRRLMQSKASFQFWTDIELDVGDLLAVAENPALLRSKGSWHKTAWGKAAWRAALAAYDRACPHETVRQIRAYALGRRKLVEPAESQQAEREAEA